jgi:hypothetical protein
MKIYLEGERRLIQDKKVHVMPPGRSLGIVKIAHAPYNHARNLSSRKLINTLRVMITNNKTNTN